MSTLLHDLDSQTEMAVGFSPAVLSASDTGPVIESADGDGPLFAVLLTGALDAGTTVAVTVEESSNLSAWSAVAGGTIPATAEGEAVACVSFCRTKRFLRCQVTLGGSTPGAAVSVLVGQQKKVF